MDSNKAKKHEPVWVTIDADALATALALQAFQIETEDIPEDKMRDETGEINPYYTTLLFNIKEDYEALIMEHQKIETGYEQ